MTRTMLTTQLFAAAAMLLVTVGALPAAAQTFDAAVEAYERGDYATALAGFQNYAAQGNVAAQFLSGSCMATARVCPRTTPRRCGGSALPPSRATPPRSPISGSCTPTARACPRTTPRRCGGTASAPSRATPPRRATSGLCTPTAKGVPEDDAEAVRWYRLAAEQGNAFAQSNLGVMYANGEGVP